MANTREFQESITQELNIIKNRVRNLIGNAHWGEEGRYKEAVLKNVLRKFLPKNLSVGTGFILAANGNNDEDNILSRQIDIIIYDNTLPLLFSEGDFILTTLSNVRGIIEVKSRITHNTLPGIVTQFDESIFPFIDNIRAREFKIFLGIFAFEYGGDIHSINIDNSLRDSSRIINHISLGTNYFIRHWMEDEKQDLAVPVECQHDFYNVYDIHNLSFSYFISNLIDITSGGLEDRYWFSFPIEGTKEVNRLRSICLD
jgi:hypothetical protein